MTIKHITAKEVIVDYIENLSTSAKSKYIRILYVDLSNIDEQYHFKYTELLKSEWKKIEKGVPVMVLPYDSSNK